MQETLKDAWGRVIGKNHGLSKARYREKFLFAKLINTELEIRTAKKRPGRKNQAFHDSIDELKAQARHLKADYIKTCAHLDRARAKLGVKARGTGRYI